MSGSNDHEDTTSRSTLLQPALKMTTTHRRYQTTKGRFIRLNLFVIALNVLLIILGGAVMGLTAYTLAWSLKDSSSSRTYTLKPEVIEPNYELQSNRIRARPGNFTLLGTQIVLINGVLTILASLTTVILLSGWPLRVAKRGLSTPNSTSHRFSLLILVTLIASIFTLAILIVSWTEHNNNLNIMWANFNIQDEVFTHLSPTPEYWLHRLASSIEGEADQKALDSRATAATAGRVSLACMISLQFIALLGLVMLRERMKAGFVGCVKAGEVKDIELERGDSAVSSMMMPDEAERAGLVESMTEVPKVVVTPGTPAWMTMSTVPDAAVQTRYDPHQ